MPFCGTCEQTAEAQFDILQAVKNVGVIELDVVYDQQFGQVVNEFRALIEECRVVLVPFDDKNLESFRRAPCPRFFGMPPRGNRFVASFLHDPRQ